MLSWTDMLTEALCIRTQCIQENKFLIIKPTGCINFSHLFFQWNSTCFGQFLCPSSGVFHCTHSNGICHTGLLTASCQQTCMTYTIAVCTLKNSWWWAEELAETCRVSFQNKFEKLVHLVSFIIRNLSRCTVTWASNFTSTFTRISTNPLMNQQVD